MSYPFSVPAPILTERERSLLDGYMTNTDGRVFALRNLPEVVKGALFSRYSRTEKSLRRVLIDEFLKTQRLSPDRAPFAEPADAVISAEHAEAFYERVLIGYGDDSVAELAGAHVALEQVSLLAAKAVVDPRVGISALGKSTRYVAFDQRGHDGQFLFYRGTELDHPVYVPMMERLFSTYSDLIGPVTERVRAMFRIEPPDTERGWRTATRAKALDLLRGLLPASAFTNLGLYGNGRAYEYLITKLSSNDLPECQQLARDIHTEVAKVLSVFVRRAIDSEYGQAAAARMREVRQALRQMAPPGLGSETQPKVRLLDFDRDAERRVVAAALFPFCSKSLADLGTSDSNSGEVLDAMMKSRAHRRDKPPRALEQAHYTFEIVSNFAAYRDLQRHRMMTQDRQLLGTSLGYDAPTMLGELGIGALYNSAMEEAARSHSEMRGALGSELAQYAVPLGFRIRWYAEINLREIYHLCELRTMPQGHADYRFIAQEMFRRVHEVHPRLIRYARFVDLGPSSGLERRPNERRQDTMIQERSRLP